MVIGPSGGGQCGGKLTLNRGDHVTWLTPTLSDKMSVLFKTSSEHCPNVYFNDDILATSSQTMCLTLTVVMQDSG